jgi:hypothetical protein
VRLFDGCMGRKRGCGKGQEIWGARVVRARAGKASIKTCLLIPRHACPSRTPSSPKPAPCPYRLNWLPIQARLRLVAALTALPPLPAPCSHRLGSAFFSLLSPGARLRPHCGPTNARLRAHLGLVVPEGDCAMRVGSESPRR